MTETVIDQAAMASVVDRLAGEFVGIFGRPTIERYVQVALARPLFRPGSIALYIPILLERFTRDRLRAVARLEGHMSTDRPQVLFVCVHNAGRSQMAAALTHVLSNGQIEVWSAGSEPADHINPAVVAAMAEMDIDIAHEFPKPLTDDVVEAAGVVITMGCGDACPSYPGKRYLDWTVDDPAGQPIETVRRIREDIRTRVAGLLQELNVSVAPR